MIDFFRRLFRKQPSKTRVNILVSVAEKRAQINRDLANNADFSYAMKWVPVLDQLDYLIATAPKDVIEEARKLTEAPLDSNY